MDGVLPKITDKPASYWQGARVFVRLDLNVPLENGVVTDSTRIDRSLSTIKWLHNAGAKLALASHFGRPKAKPDPEFSLRPLVPILFEALGGEDIGFVDDCLADRQGIFAKHSIVLLENLRYHAGEEANDEAFAQGLASGFTAYVNDAFSCAHRAHASVHALTKLLPSFAGLNLTAEVEALQAALDKPQRPVMAIVGGAKISTKLSILEHLVRKLDYLVIGGGMANTFLAARGFKIGKSLCEVELLDQANAIMQKAVSQGCEIILPHDVAVAKELSHGTNRQEIPLKSMGEDDRIFDVGAVSIAEVIEKLSQSKTLLWNGPMGVFEIEPYDKATNQIALAAAKLTQAGKLTSVAGGGDTVAALNHAMSAQGGVEANFSYVSTAGGAFLEWLEGRQLPGIAALMR